MDSGTYIVKQKTTPSPLQSKTARALARARWAETTPAERRKFMEWVSTHRSLEQMGAAQRSNKPRCPCGEMTLARAEARRHKCVAPE
jgi:hypothetical protein